MTTHHFRLCPIQSAHQAIVRNVCFLTARKLSTSCSTAPIRANHGLRPFISAPYTTAPMLTAFSGYSQTKRLFCTSSYLLNKRSPKSASERPVDELLKMIDSLSEAKRASLMSEILKRKQSSRDLSEKGTSHSHSQPETESVQEVPEMPLPTLMLLGCMSAIPFIGFGFLDNALMLLAGDLIDHTVSIYLHTSVMASAAMGNVVSGAVGMQMHGIIDRMTQKLFLMKNSKDKNEQEDGTDADGSNDPKQKPSALDLSTLTPEQLNSRPAFLAGHIGGTIGIVIGLCLGMAPLLFLSPPPKKSAE